MIRPLLSRISLAVAALAVVVVAPAAAQVSRNVQLVSHPAPAWSQYAACWSYVHHDGREYAAIGTNLGTAIYRLTDPANPVLVGHITGPTSQWRELKQYRDWLYIVSEGTGAGAGLQIVRMTNPDSPVLAATYTATFVMGHTVTIDTANAVLYVERHAAPQRVGDRDARPVAGQSRSPGRDRRLPRALRARQPRPRRHALHLAHQRGLGPRLRRERSRADRPARVEARRDDVREPVPAQRVDVTRQEVPVRHEREQRGDDADVRHQRPVELPPDLELPRGAELDLPQRAQPRRHAVRGALHRGRPAARHRRSRPARRVGVLRHLQRRGRRLLRQLGGLRRVPVGHLHRQRHADRPVGVPHGAELRDRRRQGRRRNRRARRRRDAAPARGRLGRKPRLAGRHERRRRTLPRGARPGRLYVRGPQVRLRGRRGLGDDDRGRDRQHRDRVGAHPVRRRERHGDGRRGESVRRRRVRARGDRTARRRLAARHGRGRRRRVPDRRDPERRVAPARGAPGLRPGGEADRHPGRHRRGARLRARPGRGLRRVRGHRHVDAVHDRRQRDGRGALGERGSQRDRTAGRADRRREHDAGRRRPAAGASARAAPSRPRLRGGRRARPGRARGRPLARRAHELLRHRPRAPGAGIGDHDVDTGRTTLTTPVFDLTGIVDPVVAWYEWYVNDGNSTVDDAFVIQVSNNGGASWVHVDSVRTPTGGWVRHELRVAERVTPTSTMRLRFIAADTNGGSVVEAGIDDLSWYGAPSTVDGPGTSGRVAALAFTGVAPNPTAGAVRLSLAGSEGALVDVSVHDVRGRLVQRLAGVRLAGGAASITWNGRDHAGRALPAGVYLVRASSEGSSAVARMVRLAGD